MHGDKDIHTQPGTSHTSLVALKPMWASAEVMTMVKMKKKAFKKSMKSRSENDYGTCAAIRNRTKNVIRKAAVELKKNIASQAKTDPKRILIRQQSSQHQAFGCRSVKEGQHIHRNGRI